MKKFTLTQLILGIVVAVLLTILGIRFFSGDEDTWTCTNGAWTQHGQPSSTMPTSACSR